MSQGNTGVTSQAVLAQAYQAREVLDRVAGKWSVLIIVAAAHGPIRFTGTGAQHRGRSAAGC